MRREVFSEATVELIENIRFITDLRSLSKDLVNKGHVHVGATKGEKFLKNVRLITATLDDIPDHEIKENYKAFLIKLEKYLKEKDVKKVTSISILKDFISSK